MGSTERFFLEIRQMEESLLQSVESFYDLNAQLSIQNIENNKQGGIGFNLFCLISPIYHRENLHSDMIAEFLNAESLHGQGCKFIDIFLDLLIQGGAKLDKKNYFAPVVERERGRIDVLLFDDTSKHCVIIENKIANAIDMNRQIPKYLDYMEEEGFTIDAVVYLPLNENKSPDKSTWSETDCDRVAPVLQIIPAYSLSNKHNLVDGWLKPSMDLCDNDDCKLVLKQYIELIKYLKSDYMDRQLIEKFIANLSDNDNLNTLRSILDMADDSNTFLTEDILDNIKMPDRLKSSFTPNKILVINNFNLRNTDLRLWIDFLGFRKNEGYRIQLWDNVSYSEKKNRNLNELLSKKFLNWENVNKYPFEYEKDSRQDCLIWHFPFEEKEKAVKFINAILKTLTEETK